MKEINSQNSIVAFLDILGYSDWVKESKNPGEIYSVFEKILSDQLRMKAQYPKSQEYLDRIEFTIWSDSLIYVLPLDWEDDEAQEKKKQFVSWFFYFLSLTAIQFLADTGYFLRGGVSFGAFMQKKILSDEHRFIFSQAFIDAVRLEKKANQPRILLSSDLISFARQSDLLDNPTKMTIREDIYLDSYLDYYFWLHLLPVSMVRDYLSKIHRHLSSKYPKLSDSHIKEKYLHFIHYHNTHVRNIFQGQLQEEDFNALGLSKMDVLPRLRDLGIVEDDGDFYVKEDVESDIGKLASRLLYADTFKTKAAVLASIIKRRIDERTDNIRKYSIDPKRIS